MPTLEELKTRATAVAEKLAPSVVGEGHRRAPLRDDSDPAEKRPIRKTEYVITDEEGRTKKVKRADVRLLSKAQTDEERKRQAKPFPEPHTPERFRKEHKNERDVESEPENAVLYQVVKKCIVGAVKPLLHYL